MVNRNPCKQWFITLPRWEHYRDIKEIKSILPECTWGLACKENHEDGGIHYHISCKLKMNKSKSQLVKWFTQKCPENWKRIHFDPIRSLDHCINYQDKDPLDIYEWGTKKTLPHDIQLIYDDLMSDKNERDAKLREIEEHAQYMLKLKWESEYYSVFCYACDKVLPCEDHDGLSIKTEL